MKYLNLLFAGLLAISAAIAGPGAHGPNGEHLDGKATTTGAASSVPRTETFTEAFELVGHLSGGELSIMIDRYETNEPVLNGTLEVQYKDLKAKATFHADLGDYAVDDPTFLAAISKPGSHALLFTLIAGEESDLLESTLTVAEKATDHGHNQPISRIWLMTAIAAAAFAAAILIVLRQRQRRKVKL